MNNVIYMKNGSEIESTEEVINEIKKKIDEPSLTKKDFVWIYVNGEFELMINLNEVSHII